VTVNVAGYLNGTQIASYSINESSANFSQIHLALDPSFSDVDQVVVTLVGSVNNGATNFVIGSTGEISNLVIPPNQSTALNILANIEASIPSGDSIVVAATSALGSTLTTSGSDIIYDPSTSTTLQAAAFGQSLSDSFTYTVEDSGGHAIGSPITVTLDVNDPSADAIATVPLAPGETVVSLPDHSAEGAALVSHGTSISYDPTASALLSHLNYGQSIVDHFSYVDTAGPQTVAFTVEGYDHGPVVSDLAMSVGSDAAAGTSLTIAGDATGLDDLGTLQLDNGSAKTFSVSGGVFAVSADVGLGDHVITLTLQDQSTAAGSVACTTIRQIDINIGGNDAATITSSTGGPAVLVGSAHANVAQTITGSHYADTLVAGAGNDALTGGGGGDTFVFKPVMGNDAITDFHATTAAGPQDVIDLTAFHFSNYQALLAATTDTTQGVTIALGRGDELTI
jgi:Ca2+-binding RTX toxin-like protein